MARVWLTYGLRPYAAPPLFRARPPTPRPEKGRDGRRDALAGQPGRAMQKSWPGVRKGLQIPPNRTTTSLAVWPDGDRAWAAVTFLPADSRMMLRRLAVRCGAPSLRLLRGTAHAGWATSIPSQETCMSSSCSSVRLRMEPSAPSIPASCATLSGPAASGASSRSRRPWTAVLTRSRMSRTEMTWSRRLTDGRPGVHLGTRDSFNRLEILELARVSLSQNSSAASASGAMGSASGSARLSI